LNRVILILSDALRYDTAVAAMGYLGRLVEINQASLYKVTGEHGISADRSHGGTTPDVREVPLYLVRPGLPGEGDTGVTLSQLQVAPTICRLLGIPIPSTMKAAPIL
jgi:hypothetical protein